MNKKQPKAKMDVTCFILQPSARQDEKDEFWDSEVVKVAGQLELKKYDGTVFLRKINKGYGPSRFYFPESELDHIVSKLLATMRQVKTETDEKGKKRYKLQNVELTENLDAEDFWVHPRTITAGPFLMRPYMNKTGLFWRLWLAIPEPKILDNGVVWTGPKATISCETMDQLAKALQDLGGD